MKSTAVLTAVRPSTEPGAAHYTYHLTADGGRVVLVCTVHGDAQASKKTRNALVAADAAARLAGLFPGDALELAYREAHDLQGTYRHLPLAGPGAPAEPTAAGASATSAANHDRAPRA